MQTRIEPAGGLPDLGVVDEVLAEDDHPDGAEPLHGHLVAGHAVVFQVCEPGLHPGELLLLVLEPRGNPRR